MELRHLRYFLVVGETLSFTKAASQLRIAQPSLSRQVQDLEEEIGVDLLRRSPRGVTLTAEGKLFLQEVRELLRRADESVEKVRGLARGEYGELHVGYAPAPTVEILPPALAAFQETVPRVKMLLHDLSSDELIAGLHDATLQLAVMVQPTGIQTEGIEFELLRTYPWCVMLPPGHPFGRLKSVPLEKVAGRTPRWSPSQGLFRILPHPRPLFHPHRCQTAHRCGMRQRQFDDARSGGRARHRSGVYGPQTRGWQTPALPPTQWTHRHAVCWHRSRHKGRRDTCRRKILRNLANDFTRSGRVKRASQVAPAQATN